VIPIVDNECFASGFWRSPQHEAADHSIGFLPLVVCGPGRCVPERPSRDRRHSAR